MMWTEIECITLSEISQPEEDKWHVQRKGKLLTVLVRIKTGRATLEKSMKVLQKYKNRVTLWPLIALWGFYPRYTKTTDSKGDMHPNVYSSAMNKSQIMERAQISIDWWMDKEYVVYVHTQWNITQPSKSWNLAICNSVGGTRMYYTKQNKSV